MLVNAALDTDQWVQLTIKDMGDLTAMQLQGDFSKITIFNIYNNCKQRRLQISWQPIWQSIHDQQGQG